MSNKGLQDLKASQLDTRSAVVGTDRIPVYTSTGTAPELMPVSLLQGVESGSKIYLSAKMTDISTASTIYIPSPVAGTITKITSIIDGAIATADAVLTAKIGAVAITSGAITVANAGSAAGDVDSVSPSGANTVAVNSNINITTDGASTNTISAQFVIEITIT